MKYEDQFEIFQFKLGEFLKTLRKTRDISQDDACKNICSRRTLSNIESGLSNVDLKYLFYLSQKYNFPLEEAILAADNYPVNDLDYFIDQIKICFLDKNISELQDMLAEKRETALTNKENYLYILLLSDYIYDLDSSYPIQEQDIENAVDYLDRIETWTYINVTLFGKISHLLNINLVCSFTKDIIKRHKSAFPADSLRALINIIHSCIKEDHLVDVDLFLTTAFSLLSDPRSIKHIGDRLLLNYEYGCYLLISGKKQDGKKMMRNVISILLLCGQEDLADKFQQSYDEIIIMMRDRGR